MRAPATVRFCAALVGLWAWAVAAGASPPLTLEEVMDEVGLTAPQRAALLRGEIVTRDLRRIGANEIVVLVAARLPVPFGAIHERYGGNQDIASNPKLLGFELLDPAHPERGWEALRFGPGEETEIARLRDPQPGLGLNLAAAERATLRERLGGYAVEDPELPGAASRAYRDLLQARFRAYLARGLDGIEPYDRGGGSLTSPAAIIREVWGADDDFLPRRFPRFNRAAMDFPEHPAPGLIHEFSWVKVRFAGRPAVTLDHLMWQRGRGYWIVVGRQYYVGHTYDAQQTATLILPYEDGTIAFLANSTSSDMVTQYVRRLALGIGQKMMARELRGMFRGIREVGATPR